jgi:hypothetical protein
LDTDIIKLLNNFAVELIVDEELQMARLLRKKILSKSEKSDQNKTKTSSQATINQIKSKAIFPYLNNTTRLAIFRIFGSNISNL